MIEKITKEPKASDFCEIGYLNLSQISKGTIIRITLGNGNIVEMACPDTDDIIFPVISPYKSVKLTRDDKSILVIATDKNHQKFSQNFPLEYPFLVINSCSEKSSFLGRFGVLQTSIRLKEPLELRGVNMEIVRIASVEKMEAVNIFPDTATPPVIEVLQKYYEGQLTDVVQAMIDADRTTITASPHVAPDIIPRVPIDVMDIRSKVHYFIIGWFRQIDKNLSLTIPEEEFLKAANALEFFIQRDGSIENVWLRRIESKPFTFQKNEKTEYSLSYAFTPHNDQPVDFRVIKKERPPSFLDKYLSK